jgi:hypothetical protein
MAYTKSSNSRRTAGKSNATTLSMPLEIKAEQCKHVVNSETVLLVAISNVEPT